MRAGYSFYPDWNGRGKTQYVVILSEAKNLSSIGVRATEQTEIRRFAQNDKSKYFFAT